MRVYAMGDLIPFLQDKVLMIKGRAFPENEGKHEPVIIVVEPHEVEKLIAVAEMVKP